MHIEKNMLAKCPLPPVSANAFVERMLDILNDAALALMLSIGHRSGLFDTMAAMPPATSVQIADAAGLHERYVRKWLGAMVTGGIMTYDASAHVYWLPPEHVTSLTRAASRNNIAMHTRAISTKIWRILWRRFSTPCRACIA